MRSWGDLNVALNGLVRDGLIAGFRTNRDTHEEPVIWIGIPDGADAAEAVEAVEGKLTGIFDEASVRLEPGPSDGA